MAGSVSQFVRVGVVLAVIVLAGSSLQASEWKGEGDPPTYTGNWNVGGNWLSPPGVVPPAGADVLILHGKTYIGPGDEIPPQVDGRLGRVLIGGQEDDVPVLGGPSTDPFDAYTGAVEMSGGAFDCGFMNVGRTGVGAFHQTGGTVSSSGNLDLAHFFGSAGSCELAEGGSTLAVEKCLAVGEGGYGIFTQAAGSVTSGTSTDSEFKWPGLLVGQHPGGQ